ncbi:clathrin heavy chain linker domain-containing protein 1-like isoform X1 [Alosa sapidissima]|uniref:clathrin heavy chain linker domain-containing protein 1-like isoform X1 n=1 Tax=Alosa sapidissima TaxID=34773 RepID=UPI001C09D33A|nr:clathrin heavy chain linker domain-containing protein 1-like isoform X1 [Alosa sapidissima]
MSKHSGLKNINDGDLHMCSDYTFLESLRSYIQFEKEHLPTSEKAPDEQRLVIYSSAFDKLIEHVTAYKRILTAIKKEYDDFINSVKKNGRDAKLAQRKLKAMIAQPTSLMYCQRRAVELQERIAIIQRDTAELQAELQRIEESRKDKQHSAQQKTSDTQTYHPIRQIPGLTFEESMNPAALAKYIEVLERKRADLWNLRKNHYVPMQVKAELDCKVTAALDQRDELVFENDQLHLRLQQLQSVNDVITSWKSEEDGPLLEHLSAKLEQIAEMKVSDTVDSSSAALEEDDPSKANESELLVDYIERFTDLFESGDYELAAFHAAKSPHGVLRNMETMEKFKAITVYQGEVPPLLLFFQAIMNSVQDKRQLPREDLSVESVRCALQHNFVELVTHWVTQHSLTYSEALGDVICAHGDKTLRITDTCLALAQMVYSACGIHRKAAITMCKRGLTFCALEFIQQNNLTNDELCWSVSPADDCMLVLRSCPSLVLLQALTQEYKGRAPVLSVGYACHSLLNSDLEDLAMELLEEMHTGRQGSLEKAISEDPRCGAEVWSDIANCCCLKNDHQVAQEINTILQSHALALASGREDNKVMDHVFM